MNIHRPLQRKGWKLAVFAGVCALGLSGCHHPTRLASQPTPPAITSSREAAPSSEASTTRSSAGTASGNIFDDTHGKPVFTETGLASWYGPYKNRRAADGTALDPNLMTAAHRTLPLGSTVRVTNVATGQQVLVRITDRGPFAAGRILDLSEGAAKAVGVYRAGIAQVKLEAFAHPSADPAGKWCVQTGAFRTEADAVDLKSALVERYRGARVSEFAGSTGYWVRIDPAQHAKKQALEIADWIGKPDTAAVPYILRID